MNDYIARFGLEFNPFLKNSRDIIIENEEFQEIQFRLNYLVETKGFGLLIGSPGLGKTTALRNFAASLNPARYIIILDEANHISNAILSDLKILFNFEMDSRDRAVILLAGLPACLTILEKAVYRIVSVPETIHDSYIKTRHSMQPGMPCFYKLCSD